MKKKIPLLLIVTALILTGCSKSEISSVDTSSKPTVSENLSDTLPEDSFEEFAEDTNDGSIQTNIDDSIDPPVPSTYDDLQQLYISLDSDLSYPEMIEFIQKTNLQFSEEKYNGSRQIQVSFIDEGTVQSYMKESDDYVEIIYGYPQNENSANDDLAKYIFETATYVPKNSTMRLIFHQSGRYFSYSESGCYISDLGSDLGLETDMTREDQLEYYFSHL